MYETERTMTGGLDPETLRRMREVFAEQVCSTCGVPANRLCGGKFYCQEHYPKAKKPQRSPRVYRCAVPIDG